MAKTRAELILKALNVLGVPGVGNTPGPEDVDAMDDLIDPALAELAADDIYSVADTDHIDDEAFLALADVVASVAASDFGNQTIRGQPVDTVRQLAERRLRRLGNAGPKKYPATAEYF